jgi:capsular polysaccharide biosynthesis protein
MDLRTFIGTTRRYWLTFVLVTVAVTAGGLGWLLFLVPAKYVSTAQLLVATREPTANAAYQNENLVYGRVYTYVVLLTSDAFTRRLVDQTQLPVEPAQLATRISAVNVPPKTTIVDIAVTGDSAQQARQLTDAVASGFADYANALEIVTTDDSAKIRTTVVTDAGEAHREVGELGLIAVLICLGGVIVGAVAVWVRSVTDPIVRTAERATAAAGVPVLGRVSVGSDSPVAQLEYRALCTRLAETAVSDGVLELASVDEHANTSVVGVSLGRALEMSGRRTIVLDATSRPKPGQLNSPPRKGHPAVLCAYAWTEDPNRIATSAASGLLTTLLADFRHVIVAVPPVLSKPVASAVSESVDAVVLLVSQRSKRRQVARVADALRATGAPLTAIVLVDNPRGRMARSVVNPQSDASAEHEYVS